MHEYQASIQWRQTEGNFVDGKYSRKHTWIFDGNLRIPASASPQIVNEPFSDPDAIDPEEAFVASLASCHMLWFLSLAAKRNFIVINYEDTAQGLMEKNSEGNLAITKVILQPLVTFNNDDNINQQVIEKVHEQAHQQCFIANSVKSNIIIDSQFKISQAKD